MHRIPVGLALLSPLVLTSSPAFAQPSFELLGRYTTGLADVAAEITAGETAVLRHGRLYVTNATNASLDIVSALNPKAPKLIKRVDLSAFGDTVNSVDVSRFHLIAAAVDSGVDPGAIVFIGPLGSILATVTVGAIPDMVTFTPDGAKLLVANEGEPNCYSNVPDACEDPEGTVTIIDVLPLRAKPTVKTVRFNTVALPASVRIYGPGAKQEQDVEPEYIAVSDDSRTAYVTLQENNAIAEIDVRSAKVTKVHALGFKDWNTKPEIDLYPINNLPSIGLTIGNQDIKLGGFSGLFYEGRTPAGKLKFVTHTDRGPNGEPNPSTLQRPFLLPGFAPRIVRLELDPASGQVDITQQIPLRRGNGTLLTGLPNTAIPPPPNASAPHNDEVPIDLLGQVIPTLDPLGGDFEGIAVAADGSFWMVDEYRPAIYHFDKNGVLLARYVPVGAAAAASLPPGALGTEALPSVLAQRRQNRGFEAIVQQNGKIYAFVQSPARNPTTLGNAALNAMKNIRIVELDPTTLATRQFLYTLDNPAVVTGDLDDTIADKIGDATALPNGGFLALERDDDAAPTDEVATITKRVYAFSLTGATDVTGLDGTYDADGPGPSTVLKSIDQMTAAELLVAVPLRPLRPVAKVLHLDLATAVDADGEAYNTVQKIEGLALIDATTLALINDNDFRVAGITINNANGTFTLNDGYVPEPELLAIVHRTGIDASDRDNVVNIRPWPVYGMYQPDGIVSYNVGGQRYLVTANEGDARDYEGFSEEARASTTGLPETNAANRLGRLNITTAPPLGDLTRPYTFGARSFSIWNAATGQLVWDSGAELETLMAAAHPTTFNADNLNFDEDGVATKFDNRSDNKGPEPEGVDVARINGRDYAFIALERIGGVVTYDVTDPGHPEFVDYFDDRDFDANPVVPDSGPEVVRFVSAFESPTGKPMLVVANEITGTVSLWGQSNTKPWWQRVWKPWRHHRR